MIDLIKKLSDRPVAFHRIYVKLTGSIGAGLMLSQAMYWTSRTGDADGWFYKTAAEWEEETGMTRKEQEGARQKLKNTGFWEEKLRGIPATLHFRVNLQNMLTSLANSENKIRQNVETSITETTTETTTYSSDSTESGPQKELFAETKPKPQKAKNKKPAVEKQKTNVQAAHEPCKEFWFETYPTMRMGWNGEQAKALKDLLLMMEKDCHERGLQGATDEIIEMFKWFIGQLPEFYRGHDLALIRRKISNIAYILKNGEKQNRNSTTTRESVRKWANSL